MLEEVCYANIYSWWILTLKVDDKFHRARSKMDWSEDAADIDDSEEATIQQEVVLENEYSQATKATVDLLHERIIPYDLIIRLLERHCFEDASSIQFSSAILIFMPGLAEIRRLHDMLMEHARFGETTSFRIFPLHSTISSENQAAVFEIPPVGVRKIVICEICFLLGRFV
jgi:ATP-dependent RNA helicase DHX29